MFITAFPKAEKTSVARTFAPAVLHEGAAGRPVAHEDGRTVTKEHIQGVAQWLKNKTSDREIAFRPARVLMQDFTGVPAVVDLAAMRDAMKTLAAIRKD